MQDRGVEFSSSPYAGGSLKAPQRSSMRHDLTSLKIFVTVAEYVLDEMDGPVTSVNYGCPSAFAANSVSMYSVSSRSLPSASRHTKQ